MRWRLLSWVGTPGSGLSVIEAPSLIFRCDIPPLGSVTRTLIWYRSVFDMIIPGSTVLWGSSLSRDSIFSWKIRRCNQTIHIRDESPQGLPNSIRPPNACIDDLISSVSPFLNPVFTDFFQLLIVKVLCISLVSSHTRLLSSLSHKYHQNNEQNCRFQQRCQL